METELRLLSRALPGVYEEVGAQLQEQALRQARELYVGLVGFVHKHESAEGMLPTLARAQANGVRCDAAADEPQPPPQEAGGGADIDWGEPEADNDGGGGGGGGDIDWGIETEAAGGADIDWGVEAEPAAGEIDWGEGAGFEITPTETGYESGVVDLSAPSQRRQAATISLASALHSSKRASNLVANRQLVDELMELEAFLQTRVGEMGER